jgi:hypothetical protein
MTRFRHTILKLASLFMLASFLSAMLAGCDTGGGSSASGRPLTAEEVTQASNALRSQFAAIGVDIQPIGIPQPGQPIPQSNSEYLPNVDPSRMISMFNNVFPAQSGDSYMAGSGVPAWQLRRDYTSVGRQHHRRITITPMLSQGQLRVVSELYNARWQTEEPAAQTMYDLSQTGYTEVMLYGSRFRFFTFLANQGGLDVYMIGVYYPMSQWTTATCISRRDYCK